MLELPGRIRDMSNAAWGITRNHEYILIECGPAHDRIGGACVKGMGYFQRQNYNRR